MLEIVLVNIGVWSIILVPVVVFVWQALRIRRGQVAVRRATLTLLAISAIPVLLYALVFSLLLGLEELTGNAIVSEAYARSFLLVMGMGLTELLIMTGAFSFVAAMLKPSK